jgi:hypothetical protein
MEYKDYKFWHNSLLDSDFSKFAQDWYQLHKQSNRPDYVYHGKLLDVNLDFLNALDFKESFVFKKTALISTTEFPRLGSIDDAFNTNVFDTSLLDDNHDLAKQIKERFNLKTVFISVNKQRPNNIVGLHQDANKSLMVKHQEDFLISKLKKYIVFVSPWTEGQVFMLGKTAYSNWSAGDIIEFEWFMPHATANASGSDRYILFISGVEN